MARFDSKLTNLAAFFSLRLKKLCLEIGIRFNSCYSVLLIVALKITRFGAGLFPRQKIETRLIGSILISLILLEQETEAKACGIQKEGAS